MVSPVLRHRGKGNLRRVPPRAEMNAAPCDEVSDNTYRPDCRDLGSAP